MSLVIDSSVTLAWTYSDEITPAVESILGQVSSLGAWVPALWRLEVANSLYMAVRRGRIDRNFCHGALADLGCLNILTDPETETHAWTGTMQLAERFQLTLYDAAYLELAQRRRLPLATLDRELIGAGKALGIETPGT